MQPVFLETFADGLIPILGVNNTTAPWTFTTNSARCSGEGMTSFLEMDASTNVDQHEVSVQFTADSKTSNLLLYKRPVFNEAGATNQGTACSIGLTNNILTLYQALNLNGVLGPVIATHTLTTIVMAAHKLYELALQKSGKVNIVTLTDVLANISESFTYDDEALGKTGACYGRMGVAQKAGLFTIKQLKMQMPIVNPVRGIYGDSITEGTGTLYSTCYAKLTQNDVGGNAWISGDGGTMAPDVLHRLQYDLQWCSPSIVVVLIGHNDANDDNHANQWFSYIQQINALIVSKGGVPYFGAILPTGKQDGGLKQARENTMNAQLLASGYNVIRTDQAVGLNGDGTVYDPSVMFDDTHPNTAGHAAIHTAIQAAIA